MLHKKIKFKKKNNLAEVINKKIIVINSIIAFIISIIFFFVTAKWGQSFIALFATFGLLCLYAFARVRYADSSRIKKMEDVFPDFLQLMSSNLRAGMTTDNALLLSSRKEFAPLDKEIIKLGKDIITGKKMEQAIQEMGERINSERIKKTINLLVSGMRSGGNIAVLLEETAINMKERNFVEKRAASNVLMYVIFIFFASGIGAPTLFSLSAVLVQILTNILSTIPPIDPAAGARLPFTLSSLSISTAFINYFAMFFLITTNIIGSFVIGLVAKGEEKEGVKYVVPLVLISLTIFFVMQLILKRFFAGFFGG